MTDELQPATTPAPERLKKELVRGAVTDNVNVIRRHFPNAPRPEVARRSSGKLFTISLLVLGLAASPFLAAALAPDATERFAPWVYNVPGTGSMRAAPVAEQNDHGLMRRPRERTSTLTASADDRIEDLNLRFDKPALLDRGVFDLAVRRVIIDPGHGGQHAGTTAGDLHEKDITLDIGLRLRDLLEERGLEALMTRVDDRTLELDERIDFANQSRGDVFLSIHVNWLGGRTVRGIETFYLGTTDDPELTRRASLENRNSGYSLTDFRALLDGIYVDLRRDESRSFASHVHESMLGAIRTQNPKLRDRGVKQAPFVVLVGTEMPAILAEVSALNNQEEAALLRTDKYRATIAAALADGISAYAQSLQPESDAPTNTTSTTSSDPTSALSTS